MDWDEARQGGLETARPAFLERNEDEVIGMFSQLKLSHVTELSVAFILSGTLLCVAETKESVLRQGPRPRIHFASTVFDFGEVEAGVMVKHDFVFTNSGMAALEILDVRPGCGCTTAGKWDKKIKPGKTGIIPLEFNSSNFSGTVSKQATVICNDPGHSNVVLEIKGTVWKPIEVSASMVAFIFSSESEPSETKTVRIVSNLDEPLKLSDPQCTNESFHAELKIVKEGKEFGLQITAVRPSAYSFAAAPITLKTSSLKMPVIEVMTYVMVQQPVTVIPPQIMLFAGTLSNPVHEVVTVRYTGTNSFALSDASVNARGVSVRTTEFEPGHSFNLTVDFPSGFQVEAGQKVELTVTSNHPRFPHIKVPVFVPQPAPSSTSGPDVTPVAHAAPDKRSSKAGAEK